MAIRFLIDEQINPRVAQALRDKGLAATSIHDLGRASQGVKDVPILELAIGVKKPCSLWIATSRAFIQTGSGRESLIVVFSMAKQTSTSERAQSEYS